MQERCLHKLHKPLQIQAEPATFHFFGSTADKLPQDIPEMQG